MRENFLKTELHGEVMELIRLSRSGEWESEKDILNRIANREAIAGKPYAGRVSIPVAILHGMEHLRNIYGDEINRLGCRSIFLFHGKHYRCDERYVGRYAKN